MTDDEIRLAGAADVPAVKSVTDAAYHHYIERIGVVPQPMEADHAANVAAGRVFITVDPVAGWWWSSRSACSDGSAVRPDALARA